ncbi:FAD:protein FMN transferase [Neisseria animaloris]|uniref:FAD:protein FMN transferase n=1 Tax=Neisseria animaloris TaxID=326522 RepID=UPI0039DFC414
MNTRLTRRRFIGITAAVVGLASVPFIRHGRNGNIPLQTAEAVPEPTVWRGIALGADAEMRLYHPDRRFAETLIGKAVAEIKRLEKIFSLYRDDSALSLLNQTGRLNRPPADLLALLSQSRNMHRLTQGAFNPAVQPLWDLYAEHFALHPHSRTAPAQTALQKTLALADFNAVSFDSRSVSFAKPGMALSFNGIAQGYITDRITDMFRHAGLEQALVDLGEIRGLDQTRSRTWRAGIRNPDDETAVLMNVPLQNQALATSGGYGTYMDEAGRFTHLFDPHTGSSTPRYRSVSVTAETAAVADALSTAFSVSSRKNIQAAAEQTTGLGIWLVERKGMLEKL